MFNGFAAHVIPAFPNAVNNVVPSVVVLSIVPPIAFPIGMINIAISSFILKSVARTTYFVMSVNNPSFAYISCKAYSIVAPVVTVISFPSMVTFVHPISYVYVNTVAYLCNAPLFLANLVAVILSDIYVDIVLGTLD